MQFLRGNDDDGRSDVDIRRIVAGLADRSSMLDFLKTMGYENVVSCRSVVQTGTTYLADPFWLLEEDSLSSLPECSHGLLLVAGMDCAACLVGLVAGRLWC